MTTYGERFNYHVAAELRAERGRQQITVQELATQAGMSKTAALNYLNNTRPIPTPAFMELTRVLGADPRVIFDRAYQSIQDESGMQT